MTLDAFTGFVATQYGLEEAGISLRSAVSSFMRIWQRKNADVDHPLRAFAQETQSNGVKRLLQLCGQYRKLEDYVAASDDAKRQLDLFNAAGRYYDFPRAHTISEVKNNLQRIAEMETQRDQAGQRAGLSAKDYTPAQQAAIDEVQSQREPLQRRLSQINRQLNQIRRTKGLDKDLSLTNKFDTLAEFFPTADIAHIDDIEDFHRQIREVLQGQFTKETKELESERERLIHAIDQYSQRLKQLSVAPSASAADIRAYGELDRRIRALYAANKAYEEELALKERKRHAAQELKDNSEAILQQVEDSVNEVMERIDGEITSEERTSPKITIHSVDKYSYEIADDSGTGSTQRGLISFDLALLENSLLPAVAHDSMLVQPIEDQSFDGIVRVYARQRKQVFMAIDKISRYSPQTQKTLQDTTFIHLEPGRELFGRSWSKKKKKRKQ